MSTMLLRVLETALDQLRSGFIATLCDGKILHANRAARDMMTCGWPIRVSNGILQGDDRKRTDLLLYTLRYVAEEATLAGWEEFSFDLSLACTSSQSGAAVATLKPLIPAHDPSDCVIGIYLTHMGLSRPSALASIASCFDLTPAETRALEQLVHGGPVADVARALDISENTVKTHLQNIFTKTGCSRQAQLIKLISELATPVRSDATCKAASERVTRQRPARSRLSRVPTSMEGPLQ